MFKAIVLACAIANPTDCIEFHDTRGPVYSTQEACRERAMEMARDIGEMAHGLMPISWKCKPLRKGMLS
jgi:hypothetical protein